MRSRTNREQFDAHNCETTRPSKVPPMPTKARLIGNACALGLMVGNGMNAEPNIPKTSTTTTVAIGVLRPVPQVS